MVKINFLKKIKKVLKKFTSMLEYSHAKSKNQKNDFGGRYGEI